MKAFAAEGLAFPGRHSGGPHDGELYFTPLRHDHVLFVLHNPRYAGAYFYGRKREVRTAEGHHRTVCKPREEWTVFIPGAHEGYITLDRYEENQRRLAANAASRGDDRRAGPPREGPALLQGLVVCGRCGKRMTVGYHRRCDDSLAADYSCQREGIATGTPPCQHFCGTDVDAAVSSLVLEELSPLALEAALEVSAELVQRAAEADAIRAAGVERARHAAEAAGDTWSSIPTTAWWPRRSKPTGTTSCASWPMPRTSTSEPGQREPRPWAKNSRLVCAPVAADLPALWADPATPMRERKRLIRLLVTDVTLLRAGDHIEVHIRLSGGATHSLKVPRPRRAYELHTTPATTIAVIDELLEDHPFDEAVRILNERGLTGGWGKPFNVLSLTALCKLRGIPDHRQRLRSAGMLTVDEMAAQFGVTRQTVKIWQRRGQLTGRRVDGRREFLYHPDQPRPSYQHWTRRRANVTPVRDDVSQGETASSVTTSRRGAV